eukprot:GFUD01029432.1.p1 GENE.GFUD01029432.1~~GFUD01029432.1.p1  ORF type:complete len:140 (+),score=15.68 GFUD01029432.1:130-549(+)
MEFKINSGYLKTTNGYFKIGELILLLVLAFILHFGFSGSVTLGSLSDSLFGIGTIVGFAIIVPSIILTNILSGYSSVFELIISIIGFTLFVAVGGMCIANNNMYINLSSSVLIIGVLSLLTGVLFLVDAVLILRAHFSE